MHQSVLRKQVHRPLKRIIQKHILNNLSKMILADKLIKDSEITIDVIDEEFVFYNKVPKEQTPDVSCWFVET